ncbi:MAG: cytidine deaminase, partial [Actinobacteria bacterium]|nr:cytidine deaminase [Actinomycetota bacterium]NIW27922.1 cytidine deaminase [Actinomycetota bacterium]NIX20420.1 cytidine deaminase [Actinomycetota bacterium]
MDSLLERARLARSRAIVPYSEFPVGAAIRAADGTIFEGANLEVVNFSNSLHAEEVALARALMAGRRSFDAIAVAGPDADGLTPCGMCRQTLV